VIIIVRAVEYSKISVPSTMKLTFYTTQAVCLTSTWFLHMFRQFLQLCSYTVTFLPRSFLGFATKFLNISNGSFCVAQPTRHWYDPDERRKRFQSPNFKVKCIIQFPNKYTYHCLLLGALMNSEHFLDMYE
jgi:hypothetical protein